MVCELWCSRQDLCCDVGQYSDELIDDAILKASETLNDLSYNTFGLCEESLRPCVCACDCACGCELRKIDLFSHSGRNIYSFVDVSFYDENGAAVIIPAGAVELRGSSAIFSDSWTFGFLQNINNPLGSASTWSINVLTGLPIPALAVDAAAELACSFLAGCSVEDCKLPSNVTYVQQDGVSYKLDLEKFGLGKVDKFLEMYKHFWEIATPNFYNPMHSNIF